MSKRPKEKWFKIQIDGIHGKYWLVLNERLIENVKDVAYEIINAGCEKVISEPALTTAAFIKGLHPFKQGAYTTAYRVFN